MIITDKIKSAFSSFFTNLLLKENRKMLAVAVATVIIIACAFGVAVASCSAEKKSTDVNKDLTVQEPLSVPESVTVVNEPVSKEENDKYKVVVDGDIDLKLRTVPSSESEYSEILAYIQSGEIIEIRFVYNNWGFCEYDGYAGWVSMDYLKKIN